MSNLINIFHSLSLCVLFVDLRFCLWLVPGSTNPNQGNINSKKREVANFKKQGKGRTCGAVEISQSDAAKILTISLFLLLLLMVAKCVESLQRGFSKNIQKDLPLGYFKKKPSNNK